ncbi:Hypp4013 [Branchiostoma lanceolatum]|uniref:Hypp4013 protein n=1 Tax=Branchiostoma lanceolatum TaxID=7740 RepID=A0A8K0A3Z8_BRALA|nr:Hypp4013 [Branchiostoma lanceolatum]
MLLLGDLTKKKRLTSNIAIELTRFAPFDAEDTKAVSTENPADDSGTTSRPIVPSSRPTTTETNFTFAAEDTKAFSGETTADASGTTTATSIATPTLPFEDIVRKQSTFQSSPGPSERSADVSKTIAQPTAALEAPGSASLLMLISSVTELKTELSKAVNNQTQELRELTKVMKKEGDPEVSDYTLLAKVLDRLCLVLYVISIIVAVPTTMYLGR